jgi:hypothetical protein
LKDEFFARLTLDPETIDDEVKALCKQPARLSEPRYKRESGFK